MICSQIILSVVTLLGITAAEPAVPICCPDGTKGRSGKCNATDDLSFLPFKPWGNSSTFFSPLTCSNTLNFDQDEFTIDENACLVEKWDAAIHTPDEFCFGFEDEKITPFICYGEEPEDDLKNTVSILHAYCMILSSVALVLTACIYGFDKVLRNNPHKPYFISHSATLAMAYITLAATKLITEGFEMCGILGFLVQYFFLVAFFWLNCMCIDIHVSFRQMRPSNKIAIGYWQKFAVYSVYAWGTPLLITLTTVIFKYTDVLPLHLKPDLGDVSCYFYGTTSMWLYFHGIVAILIGGNLILYLLTALQLIAHAKNSSVQSSKRKNDVRNFFVFLKLFIIMGVTWIMEVISLAFENHLPAVVWIPTDTLNALQGVFIFIVFVCKKSVLSSLYQKLKDCFGISTPETDRVDPKPFLSQVAAV